MPYGWQFYDFPTNGEPPGTIFRITKDKHRYIVTRSEDLKEAKITPSKEETGKSIYKTQASMGSVLSLLGLDISVKVRTKQEQELKFEMKSPTLESTDDSIIPIIRKALEKEDFIKGNKYYVIRQARATKKIDYELTRSLVDSLGGEANIKGKIDLKTMALSRKDELTYVLKRKFSQPMRIMFNPEQIKKKKREVTFAGPIEQPSEFTLKSVNERLEWTDTKTT